MLCFFGEDRFGLVVCVLVLYVCEMWLGLMIDEMWCGYDDVDV